MKVLTLAIIGLICLAFKSTRIFGLVALTLLALIFPLLFAALLLIGIAAYLFFRRFQNVLRLPKLFD